MKIALLGDAHFGARRDSITFQNYFDKFYEEHFFPYLIKNNIKKVIQFGDLFDNRKSTNTRTLRRLKEVLIDKLKEHDIEMWVICGNHDMHFKYIMQPNSIREHLSQYDHIHIVDTPQTIKFGKTKFDLIPWICPENHDEIMDFVEKSDSKFCGGHFELNGFDMYRGIKAAGGESSNFLKGYDAVYSGHYHTKSSGNNVQYLGTPYEITWADSGDPKGFYEFDTLKGTATFLQNPYQLHHKILYNDSEELLDLKTFDYDLYKEAYIRVIIEDRQNIPHFEDFIEALWNNCDPIDISITDVSVSYRDVDIETIETQDPLTALMKTIENDQKNTQGLDTVRIKKLANEIYTDALAMVHEGNG